MKQTCIVVPIYKSFKKLSKEELLSLNQLFGVLGKHDIFFICAKSFEPLEYIQATKRINISPVIKKFQDQYFSSIAGYNKMMLSLNFYRKFKAYNFMLIYQLDAFVFRNDLDEWCKKNYDFIGAPWFEACDQNMHTNKIIGVGNGGFSLRKINSTIKLLMRYERLKLFRKLYMKSKLYYLISFEKILYKLRFVFHISVFDQAVKLFLFPKINEDYFLTQCLGISFSDFDVAPYSEALKFSFEVNPTLLFSMNAENLPFGCHAWEKYEPEFWQQYISLTVREY